MSATPTSVQAVATIVDMLGGMQIDQDVLESVKDVTSARAVVNSIAKQLDTASNDVDASIDPTLMLSAALNGITLDEMELQILNGISGNPSQSNPNLVEYRLPSQLEGELGRIRLEVQYIEDEAERLHTRTQQLAKASQSLSNDTRFLFETHATVQSMNGDIAGRLDELSMQMDGTVADTTQASSSLLSSFQSSDYNGYASCFGNINQTYSNYTDRFTSHLEVAEALRSSFLHEVGIHADEVEELLRRYSPEAKFEDIPSSVQEYYIQQAYLAQVEDLCDHLERRHVPLGSDVLVEAKRAFEMGHSFSVISENGTIPCAHFDLEAAVTKDQVMYLDAHGEYLDSAISVMEDTIIEPLDHLLSNLSLEERMAKQAEALCGVFHGEVESVTGTSTTSSSPEELSQSMFPAASQVGVEGWEHELEERLRQYGPGQDNLFQVLNSLNASNKPLLDAIYSNSPLNTSPPFGYSPHFTNLMDEARTITAQLRGETDRLTKEAENGIESRRAQRKLGAFVDQWITAA